MRRVKKARKAQGKCGKCGKKIKVGDSYVWHKINFGPKMVRCDAIGCAFKRSDTTSSDKLARLYAAQENAEDAINAWDREDIENLRSALEEAVDEIREVSEEYQESADNIREHFSESNTADECEEKAYDCEGWADEIESVDLEEFDPDRYEEKDDEARGIWADEQVSIVQDAISNCPL